MEPIHERVAGIDVANSDPCSREKAAGDADDGMDQDAAAAVVLSADAVGQ